MSSSAWDAATGQQRAVLTGHADKWVTSVAVAPDGNWLTATGDDGAVRIWDAIRRAANPILPGGRYWD